MSKYGNKKTCVQGIWFDSAAESRRYLELMLLQRAGEITNLKLQPEFLLQEGFTRNKKKHKGISYKADFSYFENGVFIVEDTKGKETEVFRIKMKLFLKTYNHVFRISKAHRHTFKTMDY